MMHGQQHLSPSPPQIEGRVLLDAVPELPRLKEHGYVHCNEATLSTMITQQSTAYVDKGTWAQPGQSE